MVVFWMLKVVASIGMVWKAWKVWRFWNDEMRSECDVCVEMKKPQWVCQRWRPGGGAWDVVCVD